MQRILCLGSEVGAIQVRKLSVSTAVCQCKIQKLNPKTKGKMLKQNRASKSSKTTLNVV